MNVPAIVIVALLQSGTAGTPTLPPIIDAAQRRGATEIRASLDRPFGSFFVTGCNADLPQARPLSIAAVLGSELRSLTVVEMVTDRWTTFEAVRDYVQHALTAPTESGQPLRIPWSEGTTVQLSIIADWNDGRRGPCNLATDLPVSTSTLRGVSDANGLRGSGVWCRSSPPCEQTMGVRRTKLPL
jgi:hypothetical protein